MTTPESSTVTTHLVTIEKKLSMQLDQKELDLMIANEKIIRLQGQLTSLHATLSWRLTKPLRLIGQLIYKGSHNFFIIFSVIKRFGGPKAFSLSLLQLLKAGGLKAIKYRALNLRESLLGHLLIPTPDGSHVARNDYKEWIRRYDTINAEMCRNIKSRIDAMKFQPKISIVMPVYDPPLHLLEEAIMSVRKQLYTEWELCIADDASKNNAVRAVIRKHATEDSRIKVVYRNENGHISAASNSALELATGEYVALMDNDDLLPEHALFWVAQTIIDHPDAGLIYSDEDKINETGDRYDPYFKCAFNYELFLAQNMISHLGVYCRNLIDKVGGFRVGFEGSQDYDLAFRVIEQISFEKIIHIPRVLYHWRAIAGSTALSVDEKNYATTAGRRAVNDHLKRKGVSAVVEPAKEVPSMNRVRFALPETLPLVSIIIPTRDQAELLELCINSILRQTTYSIYEIIVIDNGSVDPKTAQLFERLPKDKVKVVSDNSPFNYSALNNHGARIARGEFFCFMNNDIQILTPEWLEEMLSFAIQPNVGCVGARLWYPDRTVQHSGVILGICRGIPGHIYKRQPHSCKGQVGRAVLHQSLSAVTGACLLVGRHIYEKVGGLDEAFAVALNDVDFCLRVRQAGYRNVWTPYAEMIHHESASRGLDNTPEKQDRFYGEFFRLQKRWGDALLNDPAYSPNLTLEFEDCSFAWPPRY